MLLSHAVHAVAIVALRCTSPRRAVRIVGRLGRLLPPLSQDEAVRVGRRLRFGTCLSRSVAICTRVRGATVAVGVEPRPEFSAHAWVEVEGAPMDPREVPLPVLARFA